MGNAISWQTCDPPHGKKTTAHAPNVVPKYDKRNKGSESHQIKEGKVGSIYISGHGG